MPEDKSILDVLRPLIDIADAYDTNSLDEARPEWLLRGIDTTDFNNIELFAGRGGRRLLNLQQCMDARTWARERGLL